MREKCNLSRKRKPKYVTKAVSEEISVEIQALLWGLMDILATKRKERMDYLQVFEISATKKHIHIVNKQEKPPIQEKFVFGNVSIVTKNVVVWIIDDHEKQVMLFPSDY